MTLLSSVFGDSSSANIPSQAEMSKAQLPLGYRDNCASLLIPLNKVEFIIDNIDISAVRRTSICPFDAKMKDMAMRNVNMKSIVPTTHD